MNILIGYNRMTSCLTNLSTWLKHKFSAYFYGFEKVGNSASNIINVILEKEMVKAIGEFIIYSTYGVCWDNWLKASSDKHVCATKQSASMSKGNVRVPHILMSVNNFHSELNSS